MTHYRRHALTDDELANLFSEIEEANNQTQITFFEILTVAYLHYAKKYPENINLIESGLFHRFDATNILKKNLASIVTAIGLDHLDWLPKEEVCGKDGQSVPVGVGQPSLKVDMLTVGGTQL